VGDSHTRNCAREVKQIVGNKFEFYGIVKPGASTEEIVNTVSRDREKLTKKDIVVVWGGIQDVVKNETEIGLIQIKTLAEYHNLTNIIVMSVPHRYDLEYKSSVNEEIKRFNRKLRKIMEVYGNVRVIEVECEGIFFTKHWLHMNLRGKEQTAMKISTEIIDVFSGKKSTPIIMVWKEKQAIEKDVSHTHMTKEPQGSGKRKKKQQEEMDRKESQEKRVLCVNNLGSRNEVEEAWFQVKRSRRLPTNRSEDFLWGDPSRNYKK
jgi:hypothetical protein